MYNFGKDNLKDLRVKATQKDFNAIQFKSAIILQGRPQDLAGGAKNFLFQIWKLACREATWCACQSYVLC